MLRSARVQHILEEAAGLTPAERAELSEGLRALPPPGESGEADGWDALLRLSGSVESGDPDIARDKHEHLASAYLDRR